MNSVGFVRLRGLPFSATEMDILLFLEGLPVWCEQSVIITNNPEGRPSGEALIKLDEMISIMDLSSYNGRYMGNRFIEVYQSSHADFFSHENVHKAFDTTVVRIRGLPYESSKEDIFCFFTSLMISRDGVCLLIGPDGIPVGEAFVQFMTIEDANMALQRHNQCIRSRYIEVYKSSISEAIRAMEKQFEMNRDELIKRARSMALHHPTKLNVEDLNMNLGGPLRHNRDISKLRAGPYGAKSAQPSVISQNCGQFFNPNKTIIFMRGLPYSASIEDVRDFFNPHQLVSVRLIRGSDGRVTGEAAAEFETPEDAMLGMQKDRCKMSWRYIELFADLPGVAPSKTP